MQKPVSSFVAKVRGDVFSCFHAVTVKRHSSMRNCLFGLPGETICYELPWYQRKWACSWIALQLSYFFSVCPEPSMPFKLPCTAHAFFPERISNFFEICTKCNAIPLSDPSRNCIRPDTPLQMKRLKNQQFHAATCKCVHWFSRYVSSIIYNCFALLQLLHRWQYQSHKLWIPLVCNSWLCIILCYKFYNRETN
jgi:hypothetical protein